MITTMFCHMAASTAHASFAVARAFEGMAHSTREHIPLANANTFSGTLACKPLSALTSSGIEFAEDARATDVGLEAPPPRRCRPRGTTESAVAIGGFGVGFQPDC